jgi:hypothetical protein
VARLLVDNEWYDSVRGESLFELDYEELLLQNANLLYPTFIAVRFKKTVHSEYGAGQADLALIDKQYRLWWVVEIELGSHSLLSHVEPQVAILSSAKYGVSEAEYLVSRSADLDPVRVEQMMLGSQPRVLVLVNEPRADWVGPLARYDAIVGIAEIFRSPRNRYVIRMNGQHPESIGDVVSYCHVDPVLSNVLVVESPGSLGLVQTENIVVLYQGGLTEWARFESASTVWLMPARRYPLPKGVTDFLLSRGADGRLMLEPYIGRIRWREV